MKRDMDLIRDILLKIEGDPSLDGTRYTEYTEVHSPSIHDKKFSITWICCLQHI